MLVQTKKNKKKHHLPAYSSTFVPSSATTSDLDARMARPQRHRLLHGYPMAPLLADREIDQALPPWRRLELDEARPVLVGVLPHTFCNPAVRGCGFCTFPHEKHSNDAARAVVARVAREVRTTREVFPELARRTIPALYFGGGTANLTPPDAFEELASALEETFDLRDAELSFEGAARYFLTRDEALLDRFERMRSKTKRLSVGVQTFDPAWLAKMGRTAFGDAQTFAAVVKTAHARGMTVSCDLLFNLPGQPLEAAIGDVDRAIAIGFDQICIYNLVLVDSLAIGASTPLTDRISPEQACVTLIALRERLLASGYEQTTLTNFERRGAPRFVYERASFTPSTHDGIGFGPGAISTFTSGSATRTAIKWMNEATADDYTRALDARGSAASRSFTYTPIDLRLLHVTRSLSALRIDREAYRAFFGTDVVEDFADVVREVVSRDLVVVTDDALTLTPRGMFYADAVAGLFASKRARQLRHTNDATAYAMG